MIKWQTASMLRSVFATNSRFHWIFFHGFCSTAEHVFSSTRFKLSRFSLLLTFCTVVFDFPLLLDAVSYKVTLPHMKNWPLQSRHSQYSGDYWCFPFQRRTSMQCSFKKTLTRLIPLCEDFLNLENTTGFFVLFRLKALPPQEMARPFAIWCLCIVSD